MPVANHQLLPFPPPPISFDEQWQAMDAKDLAHSYERLRVRKATTP